MFEINAANATRYLQERNLILRDEEPIIETLGWGISNTVLKVHLPGDCFVVKQPLERLRVQDDWFFDRKRMQVERDCMLLLSELLSRESVPTVRFVDDKNHILGMSCVSDSAVLWKEELLAGRIQPGVAQWAGALLAELHNRTANHREARLRFNDPFNFMQGRVDPYHLTAAKAYPDLATIIETEVKRMLQTRLTLVHGDYSPKNIFVFPDRVLTLDFEVAHYGDPAFDSAFCLNHLILKAVNFGERTAAYLGCARVFWHTYYENLLPMMRQNIEATTIRELGCLLLARIDGKSKVEYITDESIRDCVRDLARTILLSQETSLDAVFDLVG